MSRISTLLAAVLAAVTFTQPPLPAQAKGQDKPVAELIKILDRIDKALKSYIPAQKIEERLRARTPHYRLFKLTAKPAAKTGPAPKSPETQPSTQAVGDAAGKPAPQPKPHHRLLGDLEKKGLPAGTALTVDGLPILEKDIREMARYFGSYRDANESELTQQALSELIKVRAVQSRFKDKLPALEKQIDGYRKLVEGGEDFAKVAKEHSQCPSAAEGGRLGEFGRDQMVAPFAKWAFELPVGKVSPVFPTVFGYHFIKVTGKQKGKTPAESTCNASHVLVMYTKDQNKIRELEHRAVSGQADVAIVAPKWRKLLPSAYR